MATCSRVVYCFLIACCIAQIECRDEDKVVDGSLKQPSITDAKPFRMSKLNLMWDKAKKVLEQAKLPGLFAEFVVHDRLEVEWKKRKVEGMDGDGEQEAVILRKFVEILERYNLRNYYPADADLRHPAFKKQYTHGVGPDALLQEAMKIDPKLAMLWKKAEMSGFSEKELETLKTEFTHHAEKLAEYQRLKQELTQTDGLLENTIERFNSDEHKNNKEKHQELKSTYQDLKQSYHTLERLTEEVLMGGSAGADQKPRNFLDPRVRELWSLALNANLTTEELASFRAELGHFEHKINKHEFLEKEAQMSKANLNMRGKMSVDEMPDSHVRLEQKVKDYALKVKKWYTELKTRILKPGRQHNEF